MKDKTENLNLKKRTEWIKVIILTLIILIPLLFVLDIKYFMVIFFGSLLVEIYLVFRDHAGKEILIAFLFSLVLVSYYDYNYTSYNFKLGKINLFPLICWSLGLVLLREVYIRFKTKYKFLFIYFLYLFLLFSLEYIGYYFLKIQLNSNFPDLLDLGIMHAPLGMKLFYLTAGPLYLIILDYLQIK